ncbi:hypothetical protein V2S66_32965 [Streptomyces sp. V4-01]|uniref:HNH endonuclease n=1 Tax=Actinacidiphila polyblastidii TaxID=3110430 RepID=A0ABU7PM58_9ACTN|nr:hypothetical protein [Streptomyces sp. V4-01]
MTTPIGPACGTCGDPAVVHWQRRLTPDEITDEQAKEQARRSEVLTAHDQLVASVKDSPTPVPLPARPEFGPLSDHADSTNVVHACAKHAIDRDTAARIHQAGCTGCDCTPEPLPETDTEPEQPELPPGW